MNGEWMQFHNYLRSRLDLTYANLIYFSGSLELYKVCLNKPLE